VGFKEQKFLKTLAYRNFSHIVNIHLRYGKKRSKLVGFKEQKMFCIL
jgi:hypothetical protein